MACLFLCLLTYLTLTTADHVQQREIMQMETVGVHTNIRSSNSNSYLLTSSFAINVLDYGANGNDSNYDNTESFQKALNSAFAMNGSKVFAPSGHYYFAKTISIPSGVSLLGSYLTAPIHKSPTTPADITDGTVLVPMYGENMKYNDSSNSFITMQSQSTLDGFVIFYSNQLCTNNVPKSFPPTIYIKSSDVTIQNIELMNSYVGIYAVSSARHFISRITGQPIYIGIYIDECYDIGRIENVQFKSNFCHEPAYWTLQQFYGTSFVFGRTDWEYVFNTFSWGYAIGYHFIETSTGSPSGNFLGIGADACNNYTILIDSVKTWGIVITNGEFVAMRNKDLNSTSIPITVEINENNNGGVQFSNCMFWGKMQYVATINGNSSVSFNNCQFVQWDMIYNNNSAAIQVYDGIVKLISNNFVDDKAQCYFHKGTIKAIVIGNTVAKNVQIKSDNNVNVTVMGNM